MPSTGLVPFRLTVRRIRDLQSCVGMAEVGTVGIYMLPRVLFCFL